MRRAAALVALACAPDLAVVDAEAVCAVEALPADRVAPRCLPFVRDGDLAVFRAADVLQVSSLTLEAEAP